jgi:hypothetical protein
VLLITTTVVASSLLGGYASVETYTPGKTHCPAEGGNFSAGSMCQANIDGLLHSLRDGAATNAGFFNTTQRRGVRRRHVLRRRQLVRLQEVP